MSEGEVFVSFNKTKSLTGDELYSNVLRRQFFTIMTNAAGVCVGFLLTSLLRSSIEYLIPKNKYYNVNYILALLSTLIIFVLIASLIFTMNFIETKKSETIINV